MQQDSVIELHPLSVTEHAEGEYLVGDPARGEFVALPEIAVYIVDLIREGSSLGTVAALAEERAGEWVDVIDFAQTLVELGFVHAIDGVPLDSGPVPRAAGKLPPAWLQRLLGPLYSIQAMVVYVVLFVCCAVVLASLPRYRPTVADLFFLGDPVASMACLTVIATALTAAHELAHWLGLRLMGLPATFSVSRRQFLLVLETDMTALWAVPRRKRWAPLLAGIALDTIVVSALLLARAALFAGWWHAPQDVARALAAVITVRMMSVAVQFLIFMRTDIYAVMVVGLGCVDLTRVNRLVIRRMLHRITDQERVELAAAGCRDLKVAVWYRWIYLAGLAAGGWYLAHYVAPATWRLLCWLRPALLHDGPEHLAFWEALVFGTVVLAPTVAPGFIALRAKRLRD